jgi:hypothetical protein
MPLVTLTEAQLLECAAVAKSRDDLGGTIDFNHDRMTPEYSYQIDLLGAKSELAVSLFMGLPWTGKEHAFVSDVSGLEVRSSQRRDGKQYYLYVRGHDKDAIYVFCVVDNDKVVIAGWASAFQVRTQGKLMFEDTQCYGLRREQLAPMWQLDEVLEFASRKS